MELNFFTDKMERNAQTICQLAGDIPMEQARWKPDGDTWSILEVVNHLYDEEREDFRVRLEIILTAAEKPWPEIDPQGWVRLRAYQNRDPQRVTG